MRIVMVGTGYVGLVSGTCFAEFGHNVVCVDLDASKVDRLRKGIIPIYEPGLEALVASNVAQGRLSFTTELAPEVATADAVFLAVGTPTRRGDGHADLSYVYAAAEQVARALKKYCVIVTKSTVPVGTGAEIEKRMRACATTAAFDVASNPEFLREGAAIEDFMRPDRVVVGTTSERAKEVMRQLYRPLSLRDAPLLFTSRESAEVIKYAANAFLAVKISFINEMADLCEEVSANVQDVAKGIGMDNRIGSKFLNPGPGYGGSCFPKDTLALVKTGEDHQVPLRIVGAAIAVNDARKSDMAARVIDMLGGAAKGKTVAMLGLAFKPNTDDMRDAPSLTVIAALQAAGATVRAYDPASQHEAEKMLSHVVYCKDAYDTADGADILVLMTEWNQFRALDLAAIKGRMRAPLFLDLRNVYRTSDMAEAGFTYRSIGRPE
jgi:UDPglucose 6-dehydrogenase